VDAPFLRPFAVGPTRGRVGAWQSKNRAKAQANSYPQVTHSLINLT